jgi:hypothetical protein
MAMPNVCSFRRKDYRRPELNPRIRRYATFLSVIEAFSAQFDRSEMQCAVDKEVLGYLRTFSFISPNNKATFCFSSTCDLLSTQNTPLLPNEMLLTMKLSLSIWMSAFTFLSFQVR